MLQSMELKAYIYSLRVKTVAIEHQRPTPLTVYTIASILKLAVNMKQTKFETNKTIAESVI